MNNPDLIVKLDQVTRAYDMGKIKVQALRGVSLEVRQGEFIVIKGQSGSGKSTTLNLIGALDQPDSGKIEIAGQDTQLMNDLQLSILRRKHIGFIFQNFNLIPVLNALENVQYPLNLLNIPNKRQIAKKALMQVGLEKFEKHRPKELSGGQIQRVAIARALAHKPKLILADEPTANLDSKTSKQVLDTMLQLRKKHMLTLIVSSHHEFIIDRADRIVELQDGKVINPLKKH